MYILTVVVTENLKDVKTDLMFDRVYFDGKTQNDFVVNAEKRNVQDSRPKVHNGFNQFVQAALLLKFQMADTAGI